jgi:FkbH-like protein
MSAVELNWLPEREDWNEQLHAAKVLSVENAARCLRSLANSRMQFMQVGKLDRVLQRLLADNQGVLPGLEPVKLAVLGSATISHLSAGIRVAGLRRGLAIEIYEAPYGMYRQELMEQGSGLHAFEPEVILLALDARHLAAGEGASAESALELMRGCWLQAKAQFGCQVIQQTVLPVFPKLMGNNEVRLEYSPAAIVTKINELLRPAAVKEGVALLALDRFAAVEGFNAWHDPGIWYRSKHEVHPLAAESYGDQVARIVAAARGKSSKCLVLDLDNTLWGGVIGDDGLEGIVLGQGSGVGEAFAEFQRYAKGLAARGVILAVCSKNDEATALEAFEQHPEMVLRRSDIACFVANWTDKAANLRHIARTLNIGLDALVFVDDNPVERALIRQELPMVAVPELSDDPAEFVYTVAAAGYFEGLTVTAEDRARCAQYQANAERERMKETATDMDSYLRSLRMVMTVQAVDSMSLARVTQLVNKTNQFNLMTERMTEAEVAAAMNNPKVVALQVRLTDRFGDNGIIAVLMARLCFDGDAIITNWLMSCRVLGRRVEEACLNALVERCAEMGATRLIGTYQPTEKNNMVKELYSRLGFSKLDAAPSGTARFELKLKDFAPGVTPIRVESLHEAAV